MQHLYKAQVIINSDCQMHLNTNICMLITSVLYDSWFMNYHEWCRLVEMSLFTNSDRLLILMRGNQTTRPALIVYGIDLRMLWVQSPPSGHHQIKLTLLVQNHGRMVDGELTMANHISHLTRMCFYHLRQLRVVKRSLTKDTASAHSLIRALVHSRLDYCNGTLAGLPQYQLNKLQSILRASARLVLLLPVQSQHLQPGACLAPLAFFPERNKFKLCAVLFINVFTMPHQHSIPVKSFVSRFPLKRVILSYVLQLPEIFSFHLPELLQSEAGVFP